jgi:site-specific DNA-adenine methylase
MFYYYGRKKRIVESYPKPIFDKVVEPFAGSAAYSMRYWDKDIHINEKDLKIYELWRWLIHDCSENDLLNLPILVKGESLNDVKYSHLKPAEQYLIGFYLNSGSSQPKRSPAKFNKWNEKTIKELTQFLPNIKHWKITNLDYKDLDNVEATWHIDPPYQGNGGQYYKLSNKLLDYNKLGEWCRSRDGQIMVCENSEADWLDFKPLIDIQGQKHKTTEVIWIN